MKDWDHSAMVVKAAGVLAPVFADNGWVWTTGGAHVPSEAEIALHLDDDCRRVKRQLIDAMDADPDSHSECTTSSGRLMAVARFYPEDGDPELRVYLDLGHCWPEETA